MSLNLRFILPSALLMMGCGTETTTASEAVPLEAVEVMEGQSMLRADTRVDPRLVGGFERKHLFEDVYHYSARVRVGPGEYDYITLHRVVKEMAPWLPARSSESVFMLHGDGWNFEGAYLASTKTDVVPVDHSIAIYLAKQGVDVWGMDMRWTHVPGETLDFEFMGQWNMGTHVDDLGTALSMARQVRRWTGSGGQQLHLLGWSRGAQVGYAYLGGEARKPAWRRHVRGFIPVDMVLKFGPEAEQQRQWACVRAELAKAARAGGRVEGGLLGPGAGVGPMRLGVGALETPDDIADPPMPPMPYRQLAIFLGAATFSFLSNPGMGLEAPVPYYHFTSGDFGSGGLPVGFNQVQEKQFFDMLSQVRPFQSFNEVLEGEELLCDEEDLPYDDHLSEVKVPVLYVGAGGGFGSYGVYSTTLLGSEDVSVHMVQRMPDALRVIDYGHADLFLAADADTAVWAPIHEWMLQH